MEIGLFTDISGEQACVSAWDLSTGVALKNFKNGACGRNGLTLISDQYVLASQHQKQIIQIYDIEKDSLVKKIICSEKICALTASPDGLFVIAALLDKVYVWEFSSGNLYCVLSRHYQDVVGIKFTDDGKFFVTYGKDNLVIVWDMNSVLQSCVTSQSGMGIEVEPFSVLSNHSMAIQDVYLGIGGMRGNMVTCSFDQTCKIFEMCSGQLLQNFIFDVACVSVCMDVCEKFLFVGMSDGRICFINCHDQKAGGDVQVEPSSYMKAHKKSVTCLSVTMDGLQLISGSADSMVKMWHIASRKCVRTFEFKGEITNVQLRPSSIFTTATTNNNNNKNMKCKKAVGNFQRNLYIPTTTFTNTDEMFSQYEKDTIPVVLKDLQIDKTMEPKKSYIQDVLTEYCYSQSNSASGTRNTATRQELLQNVSALEVMTQDLYKASTEKLLQNLQPGNREEDAIMLL